MVMNCQAPGLLPIMETHTSNLIQYFKLEKETETSYYVLPTPAGVGVSGRVFEQLNTMS